uniref:Uncharacterized protein n=1 Tax=Klebsiella phage Hope TaxID=3350564 RepID=A0AB74UPE1_9CAUD
MKENVYCCLGRCISGPKNYYTHTRPSLTLNAPQCPHRGCLAYKGGGG